MNFAEKVARAIEEIRATFDGHAVDATSMEEPGSARVIVRGLWIGPSWEPEHADIGFVISQLYPAADVYPHFLLGHPSRRGGAALGEGLSQARWLETDAIQASRRSNHMDASIDTAAIKLQKVLAWLRGE